MMKYVFEEYRDEAGFGTVTVFDSREEAVEMAQEDWDDLCEKDKQSYKNDKMGTFRVYAVEVDEDVDIEEVNLNDYWVEDVIDMLEEE